MSEKIKISEFIDTKYKSYSKYVLTQRAIPSIRDGMKPVVRRVLWIAQNSAKDYIKVSSLAGYTMPIHPHGNTAIEGAIGTITQDFCGANNFPLLQGKGTFGGKILGPGNGIGASRYVSVKLNDFTKKIIFKDLELINEIPNYDGESTEPENFLPLIPLILLNGTSGIAIGFACECQPYNLKDIITYQKNILNEKKKSNLQLKPYYKGFHGEIIWDAELQKYKSIGKFKRESEFLRITELPIGYNRESFVKHLDNLIDKDKIKDYEDYSKEEYDFRIYFKTRKTMQEIKDEDIVSLFKLTSNLNENITLLDSNGKLKIYESVSHVIEEFTKWRFSFFKKRYEYYYNKLNEDNERKKETLKFILFVLKENFLDKMKVRSNKEIKEILKDKFNDLDYLLSLPVSSFSQEKIKDLSEKIKENTLTLTKYSNIINNEDRQKEIYIKELNEIEKSFY